MLYMSDFTPIIKAVVSNMLSNNRSLMTPTDKTVWALLFFIGLCAGTVVFFLALALYQYLSALYDRPSLASLVSAAILFAVALVAAVVRKLLMDEKPQIHRSAEEEIKENIHTLMLSLFQELEEPIRDHPKTSVTIATLAGLLAGRRI
jgi:H+/Cl- antiporter ClcA